MSAIRSSPRLLGRCLTSTCRVAVPTPAAAFILSSSPMAASCLCEGGQYCEPVVASKRSGGAYCPGGTRACLLHVAGPQIRLRVPQLRCVLQGAWHRDR